MVYLDFDVSYPGFEIAVELIVLREYIANMESGIKFVCDKYISEEMEKYKGADYHEYQHLYSIAEDEMPRIIRMSYVVTIYTLFENSISMLLKWAQEKEDESLLWADAKGRTFIQRINKYIRDVLKFDMQFSDEYVRDIVYLNKVRSCVAHTNGNIVAMSSKKIAELEEVVNIVPGLRIELDKLIVSTEFLEYSVELVGKVLNELMRFLEDKYKPRPDLDKP